MTAPSATAQNLSTGDENLMIHDDYKPRGVLYKGLQYLPSLGISGRYNSNIFAQERQEEGDYIVSVTPALKVQKTYDGLSLLWSSKANIERYATNKGDNKEEFRTGLKGNYDLNSRWAVPMSVSFERYYRNRGTPQSQSATSEPVATNVTDAYLGLSRRFNRLRVGLTGGLNTLDYEDGSSLQNNSIPVVFSDGNRRTLKGTLSFNYELGPHYELYTRLSHADSQYDKRAFKNGSFSGRDQDRSTKSILSGFDMNYKEFLFGTIGLGYSRQELKDGSAGSLESLDTKIDLAYKPVPKLLLGTKVDRFINTDDLIQTNYGLSSTYEVHHNLFLNGGLSYDVYEFSENNDREDQDYGTQLGLRYLIGPRLDAGLNFGYSWRDSTEAQAEFDRYIIGLRLTGKL